MILTPFKTNMFNKKLTITFLGHTEKGLKETTIQTRRKDIKEKNKDIIDKWLYNFVKSFQNKKSDEILAELCPNTSDIWSMSFKEYKKRIKSEDKKAEKNIEYVIVWEKKIFDTFQTVKEQGLYNYLKKI